MTGRKVCIHGPRRAVEYRLDRREGGPSMGPRPRGRGILYPSSSPTPIKSPSMGPRPRGRGIASEGPDEISFQPPSMGPRPRGRGIYRARRDPPRFRGPSMGPRPRGRGITKVVCSRWQVKSLQWGRDRAVAELQCAAPPSAENRHPSMGPRPRGRGIIGMETACIFRHRPSMGPRPRGRGIGAEVRLPSSTLTPFNGAATARSRNCSPGIARTTSAAGLQWGRDRAVAEFSLAVLTTVCTDFLQWGRDRAVAEFHYRQLEPYTIRHLQWGRDRAVAEFY